MGFPSRFASLSLKLDMSRCLLLYSSLKLWLWKKKRIQMMMGISNMLKCLKRSIMSSFLSQSKNHTPKQQLVLLTMTLRSNITKLLQNIKRLPRSQFNMQ